MEVAIVYNLQMSMLYLRPAAGRRGQIQQAILQRSDVLRAVQRLQHSRWRARSLRRSRASGRSPSVQGTATASAVGRHEPVASRVFARNPGRVHAASSDDPALNIAMSTPRRRGTHCANGRSLAPPGPSADAMRHRDKFDLLKVSLRSDKFSAGYCRGVLLEIAEFARFGDRWCARSGTQPHHARTIAIQNGLPT